MRYAADHGTVPDGYIGDRGVISEPGRLDAYLRRFFLPRKLERTPCASAILTSAVCSAMIQLAAAVVAIAQGSSR
jgi:hypothetical protein